MTFIPFSQIFIATLSTQQTFLVDLRGGEEQRFELVEYDLPDEENPDEAKDVNLTPQRYRLLVKFGNDLFEYSSVISSQ